jgi:phosphoadenosine phosphosulfate reductase
VSTKLQAYSDCCRVNLWQPAWDAVKELGITMVLRGERASERQKGPARNGHVEEGIELFQPIYDWSDAEVMLFLAEHRGFISESYDHHGKGLDCWCCTAFWHDAPGHLAYLQRREPHLYDELTHRLREVRAAVDGEVAVLHNLLGG